MSQKNHVSKPCEPTKKLDAKKWQQDGAFCQELIKKEYAKRNKKGGLDPVVSDGLIIYMWEMFKAGIMHEKNMGEKR